MTGLSQTYTFETSGTNKELQTAAYYSVVYRCQMFIKHYENTLENFSNLWHL